MHTMDSVDSDPERNFNLKYCLPKRKETQRVAAGAASGSPDEQTSARAAPESPAAAGASASSEKTASPSRRDSGKRGMSSEKQHYSPPYVPHTAASSSPLARCRLRLDRWSVLGVVSLLLILLSLPLLFSHNHYKDCVADNQLSPVQSYSIVEHEGTRSGNSTFSLITMKVSHFFHNYPTFNDRFDLWRSSAQYVNLQAREDVSNNSTTTTTGTSSTTGSSITTSGTTSSSISSSSTSSSLSASVSSTSASSISVSATSPTSVGSSFSAATSFSSQSITNTATPTTSFSVSFSESSSSQISFSVSDSSISFFTSATSTSAPSSSTSNIFSSSGTSRTTAASSPSVTSSSASSTSSSDSVVVLGITSTETFSNPTSTLTLSSTASSAKPTLTSESSTSYSKGLSPKNKKVVIGCVVGIVGGLLFMALLAFAWYKFYYLRNNPKYVNSEGFWVDKNVETDNAVVLDNGSYDNHDTPVGDRYNN